MKKLTALALVLIMALSLAACGGNPVSTPTPGGASAPTPGVSPTPGGEAGLSVKKVGDSANLGRFGGADIEWLCIAVENGRALLVTKDCVSLDVFNEPRADGSQVVWADSTLRAWLNGEFLSGFSAAEQAMLIETEHASNDNMGFADYTDERVTWKTCRDKVFLLSAAEAQTCFHGDEVRIAKISLSEAEQKATAARCEKTFNYDSGTGMDILNELLKDGGAVEYWLRSNGRGYMVQTVDNGGTYSDYGSNQDATFKGVRFAVWVSLTP